MPGMKKVTNEQVVHAYRETGSVWRAAKRLSLCGQSVWERLKKLGIALPGSAWSDDEKREAVELAGNGCSIAEIGRRLGRPYSGVAGKLSEMRVRVMTPRQHRRAARLILKTPKNAAAWAEQLRSTGASIWQFSRLNGLDVDIVVATLQRHEPEFWAAYAQANAAAPQRECPNCEELFWPLSGKQRTCSRRCQAHHRIDRQYFGGNRRNTVGLAEGICQLCLKPHDRLSSHHILGKENDPENNALVALCSGCHQIVGWLAGKEFADTESGWQRLIELVLSRRLADRNSREGSEYAGLGISVDIEHLTNEDMEAMGLVEEVAVV